MYQYKEKVRVSAPIVQKRAKKSDNRQPRIVNPLWSKEPTEFNGIDVIQRCGMVTRSMDRARQDGLTTQQAIRVKTILSSAGTIGRGQLYPFMFSHINEDYYYCPFCKQTHQSADNPPTYDHIKPLASLFNDEWPYSMYKNNREEQFYRADNLQLMCRSGNSSKQSGGEGYDPRYAYACIAFQAIGENSELEEVFQRYGAEEYSVDDVVHAVEAFYH